MFVMIVTSVQMGDETALTRGRRGQKWGVSAALLSQLDTITYPKQACILELDSNLRKIWEMYILSSLFYIKKKAGFKNKILI